MITRGVVLGVKLRYNFDDFKNRELFLKMAMEMMFLNKEVS